MKVKAKVPLSKEPPPPHNAHIGPYNELVSLSSSIWSWDGLQQPPPDPEMVIAARKSQ